MSSGWCGSLNIACYLSTQSPYIHYKDCSQVNYAYIYYVRHDRREQSLVRQTKVAIVGNDCHPLNSSAHAMRAKKPDSEQPTQPLLTWCDGVKVMVACF